MKSKQITLFFFLFLISIASKIYGKHHPLNDSILINVVKQKIGKMVFDGKLPSLSVAVVQNGTVKLKESFGYADIEKKVKATPKSMYTVGSLSKSITATGIMVLVQKGLLDLDRPVNHYLKNEKIVVNKGNPEDLTIKSLLNCTSGIPHGWSIENQILENTVDFSENYIRDFGFSVFEPGETYLYSNHAYGIAARLIEVISKKTYSQFMHDEVFMPLQMENTFTSFNSLPDSKTAVLYEGADSRLPYGSFTSPMAGAGIYSSLDDMITYGRMHLGHANKIGNKLLSDEILSLMHSGKSHSNPNWFMSIGWHELKLDSTKSILISNGEVLGGNATLLLIPDQDLMIVAMANKSFSPSISDEVVFELVETISPGFMEKLGSRIGQYRSEVFSSFEANADMVGIWKGSIKLSDNIKDLSLEFKEDGTIVVEIKGQMKTLFNNPSYEYDTLKGVSFGYLSDDKSDRSKELNFFLRRKNNQMYGYIRHQFYKNPNWETEVNILGTEAAYVSLEKVID